MWNNVIVVTQTPFLCALLPNHGALRRKAFLRTALSALLWHIIVVILDTAVLYVWALAMVLGCEATLLSMAGEGYYYLIAGPWPRDT